MHLPNEQSQSKCANFFFFFKAVAKRKKKKNVSISFSHCIPHKTGLFPFDYSQFNIDFIVIANERDLIIICLCANKMLEIVSIQQIISKCTKNTLFKSNIE